MSDDKTSFEAAWEKAAAPPLDIEGLKTTTTNFLPLKHCGEITAEEVCSPPPTHVTVTWSDHDGNVMVSQEMTLEEFERRFVAPDEDTQPDAVVEGPRD
jgi:hypothetical protein